ncbi:ABC transporter permease [Marinomonas rhizomae]|uniref:Putative spermidine/putrescine transport system permease protein n=1 Tax=Marinomonas rhizomae TaxID=491948 RepID=A0A366IWD1_9GAMM|nr:ABC transporter permease [Marinomonas rhizomae]RBP79116.1 putative spermidine/putrescine transport system permease protein [Marinomonas rhizomae]RNF70407.1 ABC transporter permease [Marinomonas rhizomae]
MLIISSRKKWNNITLLFPIILFLFLFFLMPLASLLLRSLTEPTFGLQNYAQLLATSTYMQVLFNTFLVGTLVTVISLLIGFPLSWCITLMPKGWGRFLISIILLSMWTSLLARTYSWLVLLQSSGIINKTLMAIGIIDQPLEMVHNLTGVIIGMSYIMVPFIVLPLQACMSAIDPMVLQAASICGASARTVFFRVFLPLCKPGLFSGALMVFVMSLGYYVTPALLGGVSDMMLPEFIVQQIQNFLNWGMASASAVFLILITLVLFYLYLKVQTDSPVSSNTGA